jgi:hypothetical protein
MGEVDEFNIGLSDLAVVDGRVLEIFAVTSANEPSSSRYLIARLEVAQGEPDKKGRFRLAFQHAGSSGGSAYMLQPEHADDANRLVEALVVAGATRV